jgi:hypothetical protein
MRRLSKIALTTLAVCIIALLIVWAGSAARSRYRAATDRFAELETRVQELKNRAHPRWRVREGRFSISTTDRAAGTNWGDFRLVYGTNDLQRFEHAIWKEPGRVMTAWVSDWAPRSEIAKFEQFSVVPSPDSSSFEVVAKARPSESIAMEFTLTFIVE